MVEANDPQYWDNLSERGKIDNRIAIEMEKLTTKYAQVDPKIIFNFNSQSFSFTNEFTQKINEQLDEIFAQHPAITPKETDQRKTKYLDQIHEDLFKIHIKKVQCEITFDAFSLLKLAIALDNIISEAQFKNTDKGIFIELMDPSRICLIRIKLSDISYKFISEGSCCLNISDLRNALFCEGNDKSTATLEFGSEKLYITIHSHKFDSTVTRALKHLDLTLEDIPLEMLQSIKYPFTFSLPQDKFIYTMKNLGKYSEIVEITADNTNVKRTVTFSENGELGEGEVKWKRNQLGNFEYHKNLLEIEFKETENEKLKESIETILNEQQCTSAYSLTFLTWLNYLAKILEKHDLINFSIRNDHPIKVAMQFDKLGNSALEYYLASRAAREEIFDDEDEEFDDF